MVTLVSLHSVDSIDNFTDVAAATGATAVSTMANLSTDCRVIIRFYTDVAVAGPVCVAGIIGSCLAFAALGLDVALSSTAALLLRCLAFSDGVLLVSWLDSYALPALLEFVGVDESLQSMSWTRTRMVLAPLLFISQMTTAWLTALIACWRYVTVGLLSSPDCHASRVGVAVCSLFGVRVLVATIVVLSVAFNVPRFFQFHAVDVVYPDNTTHYLQVFFRFCDNRNLLSVLFHFRCVHIFLLSIRFWSFKKTLCLRSRGWDYRSKTTHHRPHSRKCSVLAVTLWRHRLAATEL